MASLVMGPLLGLEAETQYSICFWRGLSARVPGSGSTAACWPPASRRIPQGGFWRVSWTATPAEAGSSVEYQILLDGSPPGT